MTWIEWVALILLACAAVGAVAGYIVYKNDVDEL